MTQYRQGAVGIKGYQARKLAVHPLKPGGRGQARLFGDDFFKGRFQGVDVGNLGFQRFTRWGIGLQADHTRQTHGRLTAALL